MVSMSRDLTGDGVRDYAVFRPATPAATAGVVEIESGADQTIVESFETADGLFVMNFLGRRASADMNDDQRVDMPDLFALFAAVGQTGAPGTLMGDLNGDGLVSEPDVTAMLAVLASLEWSAWVDSLSTLRRLRPDLVPPAMGDGEEQDPCLDSEEWIYCGGGGGGEPGGGAGGTGSGGSGGGSGGGGGSSVPGAGGPPMTNGPGCGCNGNVFIMGGGGTAPNGQPITANYMPVYGTVAFSLYWDLPTSCNWSGCACPSGHIGPIWTSQWRIVSGQNLVDPASGGYWLRALGQPGAVTVEFRSERCDGVTFLDQHTVTIVEHEPVRFQWSAYIPCEAVRGPANLQWISFHPYYAGDHRVAGHNAESYRCRFDREIRATDEWGATSTVVLPSNPSPFGMTLAYGPEDGEVVAGVCEVSLFPGASANGAATLVHAPTNHKISLTRLQPNKVRVRFELHAGNPCTPFSCAIDGVIVAEVEQNVDPQSGLRTSVVDVGGWHDDFPAHEMYINGIEIVDWDPIPLGGNVLWLCPGTGPSGPGPRFVQSSLNF